MATHSKYCLENPTNREPWQSMGLQRVGCDLAMEHACTSYFNQDFQVWLIIKSRHIQKCHAMQKTGAGELIANTIVGLLGDNLSEVVIVSAIFFVACTLTQFMPNTATAALLIPIAMSIATKLNVSPYGVIITCAIGASCSFATPVATPCNTLILSPSGLHFKDYLKVGLPLCFIAWLLCILIIPIVWPFVL